MKKQKRQAGGCILCPQHKGAELAHFADCMSNNVKSAVGQRVIVLKLAGPE